MRLNDLIGKPFADLGRGPDAYDCWGICLEISRRLDMVFPDYGEFSIAEDVEIERQIKLHRCEFDRVEQHQPGDLLLFKKLDGTMHFGIVTDDFHFVHCGRELGVRRVRIDHPIIGQLVEGFYRWKRQQ